MFDLATSQEFLAWLEKAMFAAMARAQNGAPGIDPENEWLTAKEAMSFLRIKESAFKRFREKYETDLAYTPAVGETEMRYQLASLQKIMRKKAVGLPPAPLPVFQRQTNGHANGKPPKSSAPKANGQLTGSLF